MFEVNSLFLAASAQQIEAQDGEQDTSPLPKVQPLAKDEQGSYQNHDRPSRIDWADNRDGQVFDADVAEQPTAQHNAGFQQDEALHLPSSERRPESERQEDERAEKRVEEENGDDRILPQRVLLRDIIKAQQRRTEKGKG